MLGQYRRQILILLLSHLWWLNASAVIPEGLENIMLENGRSQGLRYNVSVQNTESIWRSEGPSANVLIGFTNAARNSFTFGYYQTLNQNDKDAYFLRYDYTFAGTHTVALKWLHNDWNYISSTQENISLEYNGFVSIESLGTGAYFNLGIYQRWLKQSWNTDYQSPFSLATDDTSLFAVATFGILFRLWPNDSFVSFDINNRNSFNFFNSDDVGTDLSYYLNFSDGSYLRLILGTRWSGFFTFPPGYATTSYVGLGLSW